MRTIGAIDIISSRITLKQPDAVWIVMIMFTSANNDSYLVRVKSRAGVADAFIWEVCRGDSLLVFQRSTKTFPTRIEALFDSAQNAAALAPDMAHRLPLAFA